MAEEDVGDGAREGGDGAGPGSSGRRRAMALIAGLGGAAVAALMLVPGVSYVLDPLLRKKERGGDWLPVGERTAIPDDRPVSLPVIGEKVDAWTRAPRVQLGTVWIQKKEGSADGDELLVHTAECPHLGCKIGYDQERDKFTCPCHESTFGLDGSVEDGPSPRPMDTLEARVNDEGIVEVRFKRYRTQVDDQVEVG